MLWKQIFLHNVKFRKADLSPTDSKFMLLIDKYKMLLTYHAAVLAVAASAEATTTTALMLPLHAAANSAVHNY